MLVPASLGGGERSPAEMVAALSAVAQGDGSTAWCAMVAATSGPRLCLRRPGLRARGVRAVPRLPEACTRRWAGPSSTATRSSSRVGGRSPAAASTRRRSWAARSSRATAGPRCARWSSRHRRSRSTTRGRRPACEARAATTWRSPTCGCRSGIPPRSSSDRPRHDGPLYAFPAFGLLALGIAGVAVGIAAGAIRRPGRARGGEEARRLKANARRAARRPGVAWPRPRRWSARRDACVGRGDRRSMGSRPGER